MWMGQAIWRGWPKRRPAPLRLIRRHGIGGPVVVDFPSLGGRAPRAVVDAILAETLPPPFEKTAMNGFGLVQIIRPRRQLSLLENVRQPGFAALELLRRAQRWLDQCRSRPRPA